MIRQVLLMTMMVLASTSWFSTNAQTPRSGAPLGSPKDKSIEDKYRSDEIERVRRGGDKPRDRTVARFPQIKEDFERIQLISSDILPTDELKALDYSRISEAAGEIRKRATRLRSNLFPESKHRSKQLERQPEEPEDLKSLLIALDKAITAFVHNPIFENTKVVNPEDSAKAERELEKIITLSWKTIKKTE